MEYKKDPTLNLMKKESMKLLLMTAGVLKLASIDDFF
jgi:hypothetical protein